MLPLASLSVSNAPVISQLPETATINLLSVTLEHMLASMAHIEAKDEEVDRRTAIVNTQPRPNSDPPYGLHHIATATTSLSTTQPAFSIVVSIPLFQNTTPLQFGSLPFSQAPRLPFTGFDSLDQSGGPTFTTNAANTGFVDHRNPSGLYTDRTNPNTSFGYSRPQFGRYTSVSRAPSTWEPPPSPTSWDRPHIRQ